MKIKHFSAYTVVVLFFVVLSGCAIHTVEIKRPDLIEPHKTMFVFGHEDVADINKTVKKNLTGMGFSLVQEKSDAELLVDYNFNCRFDVFHYTCKTFNLFVTDSKSRETAIQAKFWADTPFSAETLVNDLFKKLEGELENKKVRPNGRE